MSSAPVTSQRRPGRAPDLGYREPRAAAADARRHRPAPRPGERDEMAAPVHRARIALHDRPLAGVRPGDGSEPRRVPAVGGDVERRASDRRALPGRGRTRPALHRHRLRRPAGRAGAGQPHRSEGRHHAGERHLAHAAIKAGRVPAAREPARPVGRRRRSTATTARPCAPAAPRSI